MLNIIEFKEVKVNIFLKSYTVKIFLKRNKHLGCHENAISTQ